MTSATAALLAALSDIEDRLGKARRRELDAIAQGELRLSAEQRAELTQHSRRISELLERIADGGGVEKKRRVDVVGESDREALPKRLREAYELLFSAAYGTDPAISTGDPVQKKGVGRRTWRMSTSRDVPTGAGGAAPEGKRPGASRRNIIRDLRAYEMKLRMDRRLRRLAQEIEEFLAGADKKTTKANVCSRCGRIGEEGWSYCPHCGFTMEMKEMD